MESRAGVIICIVVALAAAMFVDGALILYWLLWVPHDSDSSLYITGVATALVCLVFPTLLITFFLAYTFCHKKYYQSSHKKKLELLPADLVKFEGCSVASQDSLFDGTKLSLLERPGGLGGSSDTFSLQLVSPQQSTQGGSPGEDYLTENNYVRDTTSPSPLPYPRVLRQSGSSLIIDVNDRNIRSQS